MTTTAHLEESRCATVLTAKFPECTCHPNAVPRLAQSRIHPILITLTASGLAKLVPALSAIIKRFVLVVLLLAI